MALIKLSSIGITNISGKAGGSVYAHNRGGQYVRNFAVPSNPQSQAQQAVRNTFGGFAAQWRTLTGEQRQAWRQAAASFPVLNPFGEERILSGIALFVQLNNTLATLAGTTPLTFPPAPAGTNSLTAMSVVATQNATDDGLIMTVSGTVGDIATLDTRYAIYATPPISPGIENATNRMRYIQFLTPSGVNAGQDIAADYVNRFGEIPTGSALQFRAVPINVNTGERGAPFFFPGEVTLFTP